MNVNHKCLALYCHTNTQSLPLEIQPSNLVKNVKYFLVGSTELTLMTQYSNLDLYSFVLGCKIYQSLEFGMSNGL